MTHKTESPIVWPQKRDFLSPIPENFSAETGWPDDELLLTVGAKFIGKNPSRVVEINGRKFCEGLLEGFLNEIEDNAFEKIGHEREGNSEEVEFQFKWERKYYPCRMI